MTRTVLVAGATSGIARATAGRFAANGYALALAGRDEEELERMAADLRIRYRVRVEIYAFEALIFESHGQLLENVLADFGEIAGLIACYGYLGNQKTGQEQFQEARAIIDINFLSYVSLLGLIANHFEQRGAGFICALSSVAGDRGRQSNYLYGAAKGALALYLQGLRNRLSKSGVSVTTVKPGFVDTKMTFGMEGMFLVAKPDAIAKGIYNAVSKRKNVVYLPGFWRLIMLIIRNIPEAIFKKLSL